MTVTIHDFFKERSSPVYQVCEVPIFYLTLSDDWMPKPFVDLEGAVQSFNEFQNSDAPDWLKIAVNLSVDNSLLEMGDHETVADALTKAYHHYHPDNKQVKGGRYCPRLLELADRLVEPGISRGVCVVTNSYNPHLGLLDRIALEDARRIFPRAVDIPSTTRKEQLYLIEHNIISNLFDYRGRLLRKINLAMVTD